MSEKKFKEFTIPADPFGDVMLTFTTRMETGTYPDGKYPSDLMSLMDISEELNNVYLDGQLRAKDFIKRMADTGDRQHQFFKKHFENWKPGSTSDINEMIKCLDAIADQSIYVKEAGAKGEYFVVDRFGE